MSEIQGDRIVAPDPLENIFGVTGWNVVHAPSSATQAIATKSAGAAGVKHVCYGIIASIACGATAQTPITVQLLDGASVILSVAISAPANQSQQVALTGIYMVGTAATSMTLQFSGAGVTSSVENVTLIGFDVI
jgi:hypothetical protein